MEDFIGRYRILERIDAGGMAEVFLARLESEAQISRWFAVKKLLVNMADRPRIVQMFEHEAQLAIRMSHPNIVTVFEFSKENGSFFLTMEYIAGKTLSQLIRRLVETEVEFPQAMGLYIVREIAKALDYAHTLTEPHSAKSLNLVHRDVTPRNIFVGFDGMIKLSDFGIAKSELTEEETRVGELKGTIAYMSPEQFNGLPLNCQSDLFALGAVLWDVLTCTRLLSLKSRKTAVFDLNLEKSINEKIGKSELDLDLKEILQKCLSFDPSKRYASAKEIIRDLDYALESRHFRLSYSEVSAFLQQQFEAEFSELKTRLQKFATLPFQKPKAKVDPEPQVVAPPPPVSAPAPALIVSQVQAETPPVSVVPIGPKDPKLPPPPPNPEHTSGWSSDDPQTSTRNRLYKSFWGGKNFLEHKNSPPPPPGSYPSQVKPGNPIGRSEFPQAEPMLPPELLLPPPPEPVPTPKGFQIPDYLIEEFKVFGRFAAISFFVSGLVIWLIKANPATMVKVAGYFIR